MTPSDTDHNNSDRNVASSPSLNTDSSRTMIQPRMKAYPPAPFSLFFFDQVRRWKENQQDKGQHVDHACMMMSGNNDNDADVANGYSTIVQGTLQQRGQPQQRQGQRELTNFAKQVFIASNRWKQLSKEERQIWEQRAAEAADKRRP